jgi:septal ring factor EnvC (AmiA/AmiB activator)
MPSDFSKSSNADDRALRVAEAPFDGIRFVVRAVLISFVLLLAVVAVSVSPLAVHAVSEEEIKAAEKDRLELEHQAEEENILLEATRARESVLQLQLKEIDKQRYEAAARLRDVEQEIQAVELEVFDINASIENLNRRLARETKTLSQRVRSLYKAGRTTMLETVLSSSSFADALERATSLEHVLAQDLEEIGALIESRREIQMRTSEHNASTDRLEQVRADKVVIEANIARQLDDQRALILEARKDEAGHEESVRAFGAEAQVVSNRIAILRDIRERELEELERQRERQEMLEKARIAAEQLAQGMKKNYVWPLWGIITTEFGGCTWGQCPHIGIDIAEDFLQPIVAANDGVVLWSGYVVPGNPQASYGMMVVIAHSRTEETLYAHLDNWTAPPVVNAGDYVLRGQVIGYVGMTGWTSGPHLHFEYRENGWPVSPRKVLPQ